MLGNKAYLNRINKIKELENEINELTIMIDGIKDELKADMVANTIDEKEVGDFVLRYKPVTSNRLDSKLLKIDLPDVYSKYTKPTTSMRFTIN